MEKFKCYGYFESINPGYHYEIEYDEVYINTGMIESVRPNYFTIGKVVDKEVPSMFFKKTVREMIKDYEVKVFLVTMQSGDKLYFKEDPTTIKEERYNG